MFYKAPAKVPTDHTEPLLDIGAVPNCDITMCKQYKGVEETCTRVQQALFPTAAARTSCCCCQTLVSC
jgi:hypothetical protein